MTTVETARPAVDRRPEKPDVRRRRRRPRRSFIGYLFIAPLMLGLGVFHLYPMLLTIYASFTKWDGLTPKHWIGLDNYTKLITRDHLFHQVVRNTFLFMLGAIPLTVLISLVLAA